MKRPNESFEKFYERVLVHYSYGALAFMMSYNYLVSKKYEDDSFKLLLEENQKTHKHEAFEIFHFGEKIYKLVEDKSPYGIVKEFSPVGVAMTMDKKSTVANIVNKMIINGNSRPEVFSELLVDINMRIFVQPLFERKCKVCTKKRINKYNIIISILFQEWLNISMFPK